MTHWSARYVGLPFRRGGRDRQGIDCWGLVRLVYREVLGIDLPTYDGLAGPVELEELREIVKTGASGAWRAVSQPCELDILLFRPWPSAPHVGLFCGAGRMLHADRSGTQVALVAHPRWRSRRIGQYRHTARMEAA